MNNPDKYDTIGIGYNTTRKADPYLFSRLFEHLSPSPDRHYLDIGCGTGNYTLEFAKRGIQFTGIDPSDEMLNIAKSRSNKIKWFKGVVEDLPFDDKTFNGAVATLTTHHWKDITKGFEEIARVLTPGSKYVIFTSSPRQMNRYWLNHYFPALMHRATNQMPALELMEKTLQQTGFKILSFEKYFVQDDLQDLFLQCGKNRPEIYFDQNVRRGISTFAALSNKDEVDAGLRMLANDMESGVFQSVKERFESDEGDYMFIACET